MGATHLVHRDELIENTVIRHHKQTGVCRIVLQPEEALGCVIGLHIMHLIRWNQGFILLPVRLETDSPMEEDLQIRPYVRKIFPTRFFQYGLDQDQHPRRNTG